MGSVDVERQALNVFRMRLLGARVIPVESGSRTLKDAVNEALRDWVTNVRDTYYLIGSAMGPHPYPAMVRDFHRVIGEEARRQARRAAGRLPDLVVACVGGGSNAIGLFWPFIRDAGVRIVGVEAGGHGVASGRHGASLGKGAVGVLHGSMSYVLQNDDGQIAEAHSVSAGLDYPGVGPEHAYYKDLGRFEYASITDREALDAFGALTRLEGIMPALESAHAVAYAMRAARAMKRSEIVVVGLSGRGDKDVHTVASALQDGHGEAAAAGGHHGRASAMTGPGRSPHRGAAALRAGCRAGAGWPRRAGARPRRPRPAWIAPSPRSGPAASGRSSPTSPPAIRASPTPVGWSWPPSSGGPTSSSWGSPSPIRSRTAR